MSSAIAQQNPLLIEKYIAFTTGAERGKLPLNAVSSAIAQQNPSGLGIPIGSKNIAFTTGAERGKLPLNAVSSAIAQQNPSGLSWNSYWIEKYIAFTTGAEGGKLPLNAVRRGEKRTKFYCGKLPRDVPGPGFF